jgi:hypothetical protein
MSPEDRKKLEEQAAEKGLQALFKGAKLEIESVLRETCERVLEDPTITRDKATLRAVAMQMLGEVLVYLIVLYSISLMFCWLGVRCGIERHAGDWRRQRVRAHRDAAESRQHWWAAATESAQGLVISFRFPPHHLTLFRHRTRSVVQLYCINAQSQSPYGSRWF